MSVCAMEKDYKNKIFTIPNVLSFFRILLVPVFVWLYAFRDERIWALIVLIVSGVTDLLDGFIARHFHMISDLGKMLDPVADKLTAAALYESTSLFDYRFHRARTVSAAYQRYRAVRTAVATTLRNLEIGEGLTR